MKILHTSDWHLGHRLHEQPREYEHEQFLAWLLDLLKTEEIDALLVAGDIFDGANPPASAQARLYEFLAKALQALPELDVVLIGGNHDSPARLQAPDPILRHFRIRMVGAIPRQGTEIDADSAVVPLHDKHGAVAALLAAVPFLRPADLPTTEKSEDPLVDGVRAVYAKVLAAARAAQGDGQALIGSGHCYMVGTKLSELSERKILGGNSHALPADIFPDDVAYAGLGHLHLAQTVGDREHVRYSGSPIPLSMAEATYDHQVCIVELNGSDLEACRCVHVPRAVELLRVPAGDPQPLADVVAALQEIEFDAAAEPCLWPYLEVRVLLEKPEPDLRGRIEECVADKAVRLVKVTTQYTGSGASLADQLPEKNLEELDEAEVFRRCYAHKHEGEPDQRLMEAFHELLDAARQEQA